MITNFSDRTAEDIYNGRNSRYARRLPNELHAKTRRLLDQINAAPALDTLRIPPGNRLEKLTGEHSGFWSLRINDRWRIVFRWRENDFYDLQIIDYH